MIFKVVLKEILWDASVEDMGDLFKGSSYSMNPLFGSTGNFLSVFKMYCLLFLATLGLCCCMQAFPSCGKWGLLHYSTLVVVHGLLIAVASLVEHKL